MARTESEPTTRLGLPLALLRDIIGVAYFLAAAALLLALASANLERNWIGVFGANVAKGLIFVFGSWVCYCLPAVALLFAIRSFCNHQVSVTKSTLKFVRVILLIASLCALSNLVAASQSTSKRWQFDAGGVIGALLTDGLGISHQFGPIGAALFYGCLLLVSVMLVTNYLLRDLFGQGARAAKAAYQVSRNSVFLNMNRRKAAQESREKQKKEANALQGTPGRSLWKRLFGLVASKKAEDRPAPVIIDRSGSPDEAPVEKVARKKKEIILIHKEKTAKKSGGILSENDNFFEGLDDQEPEQPELDLFPTEYEVPTIELLNLPQKKVVSISQEEIYDISARLEQTLREFTIEARVIEVVQGPVVTRFELQPAAGVKVNRIAGLDREIAMALLADNVRIQAPIPGKAAIGIEIPNKKTNAVVLRDILSCTEFQNHNSPLAFGLGKDISGQPVICDLAGMPHLLIAGATGAGKSVCLNSIIISILMRMPPERVKFIMIDPKRVELSNYQEIPHLLAPVVVDPRKAAGALSWAIEEMERRYRQLESMHVRNIGAYNTVVSEALDNGKALRNKDAEPMPYIVLVVDELADLMLVARSEVEEGIQRLAQMSRAVGIHLILATQRPSVNVITGVIKANFPTRIAFRVSSKVDSRTILDSNGAEALLGRGDMIYSPGGARTYRIQGAFVSDTEVERVSDMIREQCPPQYTKEDFIASRPKKNGRGGGGNGFDESEAGDPGDEGSTIDFGDDLYLPALKLVLESRQASVSLIQRRMKIGYARAGRLMDLMEQNAVVGPFQGSKPRDLLVDPDEHLTYLESQGMITRDGFHAAQ